MIYMSKIHLYVKLNIVKKNLRGIKILFNDLRINDHALNDLYVKNTFYMSDCHI